MNKLLGFKVKENPQLNLNQKDLPILKNILMLKEK